MSTQQTCLAGKRDIQDIDTLLCSAQEPIGLSLNFCGSEMRSKRCEWLEAKVAHNLLWVVRDGDDLVGVLVLEQDLLERVVGIAYIVVAERMRGQRVIGPMLVEKSKSLADTGFLEAEARNDNARRLLARRGFQKAQRRSSSGYPILIWSRS